MFVNAEKFPILDREDVSSEVVMCMQKAVKLFGKSADVQSGWFQLATATTPAVATYCLSTVQQHYISPPSSVYATHFSPS